MSFETEIRQGFQDYIDLWYDQFSAMLVFANEEVQQTAGVDLNGFSLPILQVSREICSVLTDMFYNNWYFNYTANYNLMHELYFVDFPERSEQQSSVYDLINSYTYMFRKFLGRSRDDRFFETT